MSSNPSPSLDDVPVVLAPGVVLASAHVKVDQIVPELARVVVFLGGAHVALFGAPLVITSGNDGTHAPGSKHFQNKAVDLRSHDLDPDSALLFATLLAWTVVKLHVNIFDEREVVSGPHWHIEV